MNHITYKNISMHNFLDESCDPRNYQDEMN